MTISKLICALIVTFACGSLFAARANGNDAEAFAAASPIVICAFANGDRVRGPARNLAPEVINLATEYAGVVAIKPSTVVSCETDDPALQLRLNDVIESSRTLIAKAAETSFVATAAPPQPTPIRPESVWKKTFAFSYNLSRGNSDINDMNLSGGVEYKEPEGRLIIQSLMRRGTKNGQDIAGLFTSTARYERNVDGHFLASDKVTFFNEFNYERDAMKRIDHRVVWNGGMLLPLYKKESNELALDLGGGLTREVYATDVQRTLGSGLIRLKSEQKILGNTRLTQQVAAFPDFAEVGRYRLHADVSVTAPLTKIFSVRIGALNRFDNRPQEAVKRNDFSLLSGLAVSF